MLFHPQPGQSKQAHFNAEKKPSDMIRFPQKPCFLNHSILGYLYTIEAKIRPNLGDEIWSKRQEKASPKPKYKYIE